MPNSQILKNIKILQFIHLYLINITIESSIKPFIINFRFL